MPETAEQLVGKTGRLTVRVKGDEQPGELVLRVGGMTEQYLAYCSDRIEAGSVVLVVHHRGARSVDVVPWQLAPGDTT